MDVHQIGNGKQWKPRDQLCLYKSWPKSQPFGRSRAVKVPFLDFQGFSHVTYLKTGEELRHEPWNTKWTSVMGESPKNFFMKLWCRPAEIWDFEKCQIHDFQSPIFQLAYIRSSWKFFWRLSHDWSQFGILWFMSRIHTSFEKNDMKNDSWNHGNPKMALSLPLISQMVGIWAMTHKDTIDLWVIIVYHSRFGGLPFSRELRY